MGSSQSKKKKSQHTTPRAAARAPSPPLKVLVLGTSNSGKTTFIKQLKHVLGDESSVPVDGTWTAAITKQVLVGFQRLIVNSQRLGIAFDNEEVRVASEEILSVDTQTTTELTPALSETLKRLLDSSLVQAGLEEAKTKFSIPENFSYFAQEFDRISSTAKWTPTKQDILRCHQQTTKGYDNIFTQDRISFNFIDIGGSRSSRKRWIHHFEDVTSILYLVNLSDYPYMMDEDECQGSDVVFRLVESLRLWNEVVTSKWFASRSFGLIFTRVEEFKAKIRTVPLSTCFQDYTGPANDPDASLQWIKAKFLESQPEKYPNTQVSVREVDLFDDYAVSSLFNTTHDAIMSQQLAALG